MTSVVPQETPPSVYLIGNSLTWDTVPSKLDGDVKWHVDCGKSLLFVRDHPEKPCVASSTLWPQTLKEQQFDFVSFQPHYGTTVEQDVEVISGWITLQSKAIVVIHTGWPRQATLGEERTSTDISQSLFHGDAYFDELFQRLREKHPLREFRMTGAMNLLHAIADDIEKGVAPIDSISELYRDKIHMTLTAGRYLMHNAMRRSLGQSRSVAGFEKVPVDLRQYLNAKLDQLESGAIRENK
ncbi:hypothetical protein [Planctomycetes bacterium K23_9]|uniref:hypothetical protein n=1 Tax=Stieleria marina TaxID=1930275 RepID=UPI0011A18977